MLCSCTATLLATNHAREEERNGGDSFSFDGSISGCLSSTREAGIEVTKRWQIELMKDIQMFWNQLTDVLGLERSSDVF